MPASTPLLTPRQLAETAEPVRVLDVQFTLSGEGPALHASAHLAGGPHLDLDAGLAGPPGEGGRHSLIDAEVVQAGLRALGVCEGEGIVVYDPQTSLAAARSTLGLASLDSEQPWPTRPPCAAGGTTSTR